MAWYWGPPCTPVLETASPNNRDGVTASQSTGCVPLPCFWGTPTPVTEPPAYGTGPV